MPKFNPKHKRKREISLDMGKSAKKKDETCNVAYCSQAATHHISKVNLDGYITRLRWELKTTNKKTRKVALCKKHYKAYKKLKDKDEKYLKFKDVGKKSKMPKRDKAHYFLE